MKKRLISCALMLCIVLSILPLQANATVTQIMKYGQWIIGTDDSRPGEHLIIGFTGTQEDVYVPAQVPGYTIEGIHEDAFKGNTTMKRLHVPIRLNVYGLGECDVEEVTLEEHVTLWGDVFADCKKLKSVKLPDTLFSIPSECFKNCVSLTSITVPEKVESIYARAFQGCTALTSVQLSKNLQSIDSETFSGCISLASISIPEGVRYLGDNAFGGCTNLKETNIPASLTDFYYNAFSGCGSLESLKVAPGNPVYFNDEAGNLLTYSESEQANILLRSLAVDESGVHTVPAWIDVVGDCAFSGDQNLRTLIIPSHVQRTGQEVFTYCGNLSQIYIIGDTPIIGFRTFGNTTATVLYPEAWNDLPWGSMDKIMYEGNVTWIPYSVADSVTRVFGADRYQTAFKVADELKSVLGVEKFQNVIVASGTGFADALAGSYLAAVKDAPILLVRGANVNNVKDYIKANLTPGGTVYLLGGVNAVPKALESGLDGFSVKRLGGANRYDTNLLILQEAGVGDKDIIVCTGLDFADSLSASATGLPILLVKDGLYASQKEFLKSVSGNFIIVGGSNAVNGTVEKQLSAFGSVSRIAGNTRYMTSVKVAEKFFGVPSGAVLAYAMNFPDGLCGGPLACNRNMPLILTASGAESTAADYAAGFGIRGGYVLGGTGLIRDGIAKKIFSTAADDPIIVK